MPDDLELNPYAPPRSVPPGEGFWRRLLNAFTSRPVDLFERFRQGAFFVHYGVYFRVQPGDSAHVFAYVPWTNADETRAQLNVLEARCSLTVVTSRYAELKALVAGRALVVVLVPSYEELDDEIRRVVIPAAEWEAAREADDDPNEE